MSTFDWLALDKLLKEKTGKICLSDWTPGDKYVQKISQLLKYEGPKHKTNEEQIHYPNLFVENQNLKQALLAKLLGNQFKNAALCICKTNTTSIANILLYLSRCKTKKIAILVPRYFTSEVFSNTIQLDHELVPLEDGKIPFKKLNAYDALWIARPVYGLLGGFSQRDADCFRQLLDKGIKCIFDECNVFMENGLINKISLHKNALHIYSPHKAISMNGEIKFSCIISEQSTIDELLKHTYMLSGTQTNINEVYGIKHFLSKNYDLCKMVFRKTAKDGLQVIREVVAKNSSFARIDEDNVVTYYVAVTVNKKIQDVEQLMVAMTSQLDFCIYPMSILDCDCNEKFSFRVNLLHDKEEIRDGLSQILVFLKEYDG